MVFSTESFSVDDRYSRLCITRTLATDFKKRANYITSVRKVELRLTAASVNTVISYLSEWNSLPIQKILQKNRSINIQIEAKAVERT